MPDEPNLRWNCAMDGCYRDQLPDWTPFNDCFPRGIRISDVDGIVEVGNRFLMFEWKGPEWGGWKQDDGQHKLLVRFGKPPDAVVCLRGTVGKLRWLVFDGTPAAGWQPVALSDVKAWVRQWATVADSQPWGGAA